MKAKAEKLALALGMMVIATSCTTTSNSSNPTQSSQKATEVTNSVTVATIKIEWVSVRNIDDKIYLKTPFFY